jgi:hypothetical protein
MVQLDAKYARHSKFMQQELDNADKEREQHEADEAENVAYGLY